LILPDVLPDPSESATITTLDEFRVPYRMLFEHNPLPMWVVDLESLEFLAVNDAALHLYDYPREAFLALKLTDIRPLDDVPAILAKVAEVSSRGFDDAGIWRHRKRNGDLIWVEVTSHALEVAGRAARLALVNDVTERLRVEAEDRAVAVALQMSEERFRYTLEAADVGTWDWDLKTSAVTRSDNLLSIYGVGAERVGKGIAGFLRLVHPGDRKMVVKAVQRTLRQGVDYRVEFRVIDDQGDVRWLVARGQAVRDERGKPVSMVGITVDVSQRRRSDEELRLSERRFRTMIEQSPLSTSILTPDGDTIATNKAWERLWGFTLEEIGGYNPLTDEMMRESGIADKLRLAFAGEAVTLPPLDYMLDHGRFAGSPRSIRVVAYPLKDDENRVREVVMIEEDITDRQQAESRLALYRQVVANAKDAIAVIDTEGRYVERNDAHRELLGYSDEELAGQTPAIHLGEKAFAAIFEELTEHGSFRGDAVSTASDGHQLLVDFSGFAVRDDQGKPVCYVSIKRDSTARVLTEKRLREETETLEVVNRISRLVSSELDVRRLVQVVTDAATELTGAEIGAFFQNEEQEESFVLSAVSGLFKGQFADLPEPRPTHLFDTIFRGDSVVRIGNVAEEPLFSGIPAYFGLASNHPMIASFLAVPLHSRSGSVLGGLLFGHSRPDVFTERAERIVSGLAAQAAIAMDNANLFQQLQEALRARDEFLSIAAHELRTPVAGVKGFSQLILRALDRGQVEPDRLRKSVQAIERSSTRLAALTNDLLDVSRIRLGQLPLRVQTIDLTTFAGELVSRFQQQLDERHTIALVPNPQLAPVAVDSDRLEQVVVNLLENAAKYSPNGGEIRVDFASDVDGVRLSVHDHGIGLPAEELETIFEPFGRAANAAASDLPGLGLGLYISRNIIKRHGGRIWAESPGEGMGSNFSLWLPVAGED
jgi:PAS domain S-box-containing protein